MDFKSNQFTIFAICLIVLILISFFEDRLYVLFKITPDASIEYRPVNLGDERVDNDVIRTVKLGGSEKDNQTVNSKKAGPTGPTGPRRDSGLSGPSRDSGPTGPTGGSSKNNKKCKKKGTGQANVPPSAAVATSVPQQYTSQPRDSNTGAYVTQRPNDSNVQLSAANNDSTYDRNGNYMGGNTQTTLGVSNYLNQQYTTPLPSGLPESANLGVIAVLNDIQIGDTENIILDTSQMALTKGMQLVIGDVNATITEVITKNNWFTSQYEVTINVPSPIFVAVNSYLMVLSPKKSSDVSPDVSPSGKYSDYNSLNSPSTEPSPTRLNYVLYLSKTTSTENVLILTPSLNVTSETLKLISLEVISTNEPQITANSFTSKNVIEGLDTPTPSMTETPTPSMTETPTPTMNQTYTPTQTPTMNQTTTMTQTPAMTMTQTPTMNQTMTMTQTPTMIPTAALTPTPAINTKLVTCGPKPSSSTTDLSIFYVSDCVGYHIKWITYKLDSLLIKLDSPDKITLYPGYYKLVV
jgi:hypothetical protein